MGKESEKERWGRWLGVGNVVGERKQGGATETDSAAAANRRLQTAGRKPNFFRDRFLSLMRMQRALLCSAAQSAPWEPALLDSAACARARMLRSSASRRNHSLTTHFANAPTCSIVGRIWRTTSSPSTLCLLLPLLCRLARPIFVARLLLLFYARAFGQPAVQPCGRRGSENELPQRYISSRRSKESRRRERKRGSLRIARKKQRQTCRESRYRDEETKRSKVRACKQREKETKAKNDKRSIHV